jgi:hypothetical protein
MDARARQMDVAKAIWDMCIEMHSLKHDARRRNEILNQAAKYAWALYHDLNWGSRRVSPIPEAIRRRWQFEPCEPVFFQCLDTLEEFAAQAWATLAPSNENDNSSLPANIIPLALHGTLRNGPSMR